MRNPELEKRFHALYVTTFGKWPTDSEKEDEIWWDFVAKLDADRLEPLFDAVAKEWGRRLGTPRIQQFASVWRTWEEKKPKPPRTEPTTICAYCGNRGRTWYLAYRDGDGNWHVSIETNHGLLSVISAPCTCDFGAPMRFEVTPQFRTRVHHWWLETLMPESERRKMNPAILAHELIRESAGGPTPMLDWQFDHGGKVFKHRTTGAVWGAPAVAAVPPRETGEVPWREGRKTATAASESAPTEEQASVLTPEAEVAMAALDAIPREEPMPEVGEAGSWQPTSAGDPEEELPF